MSQTSGGSAGELDQYFIRVQGKVLGPFNSDKLKSLRARGQFSRAHEVSTDRRNWRPASTLDDLFAPPTPKLPKMLPDAEPADSFALQPTALQPTALQPTAGQPTAGQPTAGQPTAGQSSATPATVGPIPKWHYDALGERHGPVTIMELRNLMMFGTLLHTDFVWREGLADWIPVSEVPELQTVTPSSKSGAASQAKDATKDALQALLTIATNPVGGISESFEGLGEQRALGVGLVFAVLFALCQLFVSSRILAGARIRPNELWILVYALVPFVSLVGVCFMLRMVFRGAGSLAHDCFLAGAALLPTGVASVLASVLGAANIEVILVIVFAAFCLTILMLYAGLTKLSRFSERLASFAVPLMLLAAGWLCKILYATLLKDQISAAGQNGLF